MRWAGDHDFESVAAALKRKAEPDIDPAAKVAALKAELAPTAGPTARRTLEDMAEANPELHARVEAVRAANPGLAAPPLREPQPPPPPDPAVVETEQQVTEEAHERGPGRARHRGAGRCGVSVVVTFSGSFDPFAEAIETAKRQWPDMVHLRVAENVTLCERAGDATKVDVWGQYLTDAPGEVGCPKCLEWMHA
jgi:phage tail protein X